MGPAALLYADDVETAVHAVVTDAHLDPWDVEALRLSEVLSGGGARLIGATAAPCVGTATTAASLRDAVTRVEGRVAYAQWSQARADLDAATASVACLTEPMEASIGARLFLLDGLVWSAKGEPVRAQDSFAEARAFQSTIAWDAAFPEVYKAPFDAALAAPAASTTVTLGPGVAPGTMVWVDGRPSGGDGASFPLTAGRHVVQVIGTPMTTLPVTVSADARLVLVIPSAVTDDVVAKVSDPAARASLDGLLPALFPGRAVYVWTGEALVDATNGWTTLPHASGRPSLGPALLGGGAVLAGLGAVGAGVGAVGFLTHQSAVAGESNSERADRVAAAGRGAGMTTLGVASVAVGLAGMGVGLALGGGGDGDSGTAVSVSAGPTGFVVTVGGAR